MILLLLSYWKPFTGSLTPRYDMAFKNPILAYLLGFMSCQSSPRLQPPALSCPNHIYLSMFFAYGRR